MLYKRFEDVIIKLVVNNWRRRFRHAFELESLVEVLLVLNARQILVFFNQTLIHHFLVPVEILVLKLVKALFFNQCYLETGYFASKNKFVETFFTGKVFVFELTTENVVYLV